MAKRAGNGTANARRLRAVSIVGATAGTLGGLVCSASMILAATGVIGAAGAGGASSMLRMASRGHPGAEVGEAVSGFLLDHGPTILIVSIVLIGVSLALRRPGAAVAAAAVGAVMYWGMYVQQNLAVIYPTIGMGLVTWLALLAAASSRKPLLGGSTCKAGRYRARARQPSSGDPPTD